MAGRAGPWTLALSGETATVWATLASLKLTQNLKYILLVMLSLTAGYLCELLCPNMYFQHFQCLTPHLLFWLWSNSQMLTFLSPLPHCHRSQWDPSCDHTTIRPDSKKVAANKRQGWEGTRTLLSAAAWIKRIAKLLPKVELYHQFKRMTKLSSQHKYSSWLTTSSLLKK